MTDERPDRAPVDLVWPERLVSPNRPPPLLYLDLNHWIGLSKASIEHRDGGKYVDLLRAAGTATQTGRVQIVLTASLFEELSSIRDPRQRRGLAEVIEELSDFNYLSGLVDIMRVELGASIDALTGTSGIPWQPIDLVSKGVLRAFGRVGGLRILEAGGLDVTEVHRKSGVVDIDQLERMAERMLLSGPGDDEIEELRRNGYRPEIHRQSMADNATIEQSFADGLDEHWRRGRLRDVLLARELNLELWEMFVAELAVRHLSLEDVCGTRDRSRQLILCMPSRAVSVEMKTHFHRNARKQWTTNDLHDINALANSVPYCDIVFTDAAARDCLLRASIDERMMTSVPRTPDDLVAIIENL